jgi:hypothetical protein
VLDDGRRFPELAQVLDEIEGIGPERCSAGIEPEHRRSITAPSPVPRSSPRCSTWPRAARGPWA